MTETTGCGYVYGLASATALIQALADRLGLSPGHATLGQFADGERQVEIHDALGGQAAVLVVPTGPPVDGHVMTLALLADACRRASASRIIAVVPYFGYGRGDRLAAPGQPVAARVVANLLEAAGITHLISLDLHNPAITGFFTVPVVAVSAVDALAAALADTISGPAVAVAPDAGALPRTAQLAARLGVPMAVVAKRRLTTGQPKALQLMGDVHGRRAIVIDDMITTAGTLEQVGLLLHQQGAASLAVAATHAVMTADAVERLRAIGVETLVVTDSLPWQAPEGCPGWRRLPIAPLLVDAVAWCLNGVTPRQPHAVHPPAAA